MTSLPDSIGNLPAISILELSTNQLTAVSDPIGRLTTLTQLDLTNSCLTADPSPATWLNSNDPYWNDQDCSFFTDDNE